MSIEPLNFDELIESGKHVEDDLSLPSPEGEGITREERVRRSEDARVEFESMAEGKLPVMGSHFVEANGVTLEVKREVSGSDWRNIYKILREAGWPWRKAVFIAWCASPRKDRWPKTQEELATQVLGLTSDRVFTQWRQKEPQIDDAIATMQAAPLWAHRADVLNALVDSAANSDHRSNPDRKLFLEMTGDYTPKQKVEMSGSLHDGDDLSGMTEKDLLNKARQGKND